MTSKNDGGPAYPRPGADYQDGPNSRSFHHGNAGMSLRDWFAGQALLQLTTIDRLTGDFNFPEIAHDAYQLADAMLAERAKVQP